ncbi:hypothetical protein B0H14DRAFT_2578180 [Mycena olivaceomarginata]|nr:hypothetical protein B0H14DRAFT_2578180 [Mycena olivaceomarginata]
MDDIAATFRDLVSLMRDYRKSGPTAACFEALDAVHSRLEAAHEFPRDAESPESFSAILTKSMAAPIQIMTAQLQAHHKALQSLTKSVESIKAPRPEAHAAAAAATRRPVSTATAATEDHPRRQHPRRAHPPALQRRNPPNLRAPPSMNLFRSLPHITCATRTKDGGLFLVPESKEAVKTLVGAWPRWGPEVFPGARVIPPSIHSHIQIDGIPHAAAPRPRPPGYGVHGADRWYGLTNPPSEAQISATRSAGGKPRTAGSIFVRLGSREKVDLAVSMGRLRLAGSAPTVVRGFPHLRVTQCWGCMKFGHVRARCTVKEPKCAGCGDKSHGAVCSLKPRCLNCGARKAKAQALRQRAVELTAYLNATSTVPVPSLAPRLPESINSWKSRSPLDILTSDGDFDIICVQEPHHNEALNARDFPEYALIYPDAHDNHRVSVFVKLSKIPPSSICPRPDLSTDGDILVIEFTFGLFNSEKMDLDAYLGILRNLLDDRPLPVISTPEELDNAVEFLNSVLLAALEGSTPRHTPSSMAKRWWSPEPHATPNGDAALPTHLPEHKAPSAKSSPSISEKLERVNVYKALKRLKESRTRSFSSYPRSRTGSMIISHHERGRALGRACFVTKLWKLMMLRYLCPRMCVRPRVQTNLAAAPGLSEGGPFGGSASSWTSASADRQESLPAPRVTSEAPHVVPDPIALAESIDIADEREFVPVTDAEVDSVIMLRTVPAFRWATSSADTR